jgi:hypothetical protein|nr:MAG TPA: hypothetical protein [Caudoviricetes sp.]
METYYTKVDVQADRWVAEVDKPTIIVENEEMTEEEFKRYNLDEDCSCG